MFNFFKKQVHEPVEKQREECRRCYPELADIILSGEDCDVLSSASGEFGKNPNNPIPVNCLGGLFKYFFKLRVLNGAALFFHKVCTAESTVAQHGVDVYETVSMDGAKWDVLFFDIYHPRRSNKAPKGYELMPYDETYGDVAVAYGVDSQVLNFPYDLPARIAALLKNEAFGRRATEALAKADFTRPNDHLLKLAQLKVSPLTRVVEDPKTGARFYVNPRSNAKPQSDHESSRLKRRLADWHSRESQTLTTANSCFDILATAAGQIGEDVKSGKINDPDGHIFAEATLLMYSSIRCAIQGTKPHDENLLRDVCNRFDKKVAAEIKFDSLKIDVDARLNNYWTILCNHIREIAANDSTDFNLALSNRFVQFCLSGKPNGPVVIGDFAQNTLIRIWILDLWWLTYRRAVQLLRDAEL